MTGCGWSGTSPATRAPWRGSWRSRSGAPCSAVPPTTTTRSSGSIVANADQLVVVAALADPEPRPRLIDRALVAAYDAGLEPLLCLTKPDLADPETLLAMYRPLGVPYVVTEQGRELADVRERLEARISVLIGHSGVGKSTLVNGLVPGADRAIGVVNEVTGRGRHTSTSALMLRLPETDTLAAGGSSTPPGSGRSGSRTSSRGT